ncbi:MAG: hypothetical protein ACR2HR_16455 [Euzebya sp.]
MEDDFDLDDADRDNYRPDEDDYDDVAMSEWAYEADLQLRERLVDDHHDEIVQKAWASKPGPVDLDRSEAVVRHIGMALEGLSIPARWNHLRRATDLSDESVGADPPTVTWHVVEVECEIGCLLDDGSEATMEINLVSVVAHVDRRQLPTAAAMRWLAEHQRALQDLVQNTAQTWRPGLSGAIPDLVAVKWRSLLGVDGHSSRALPDTETIVAAMCLLADEAEHRLWIEVPWWVTQRSGRRALTRFCAAAG